MASGALSTAKANLALLMARAATWRTLTGTSNQSDALLRIMLGPFNEAETPALPFAWIQAADGNALRFDGVGVNTRSAAGTLQVVVECGVVEDGENSGAAAQPAAEDTAGDLLAMFDSESGKDLGNGSTFIVRNARMTQEPRWIPIQQQGVNTSRYFKWQAIYEIDWGVGG